MVFLRRASMVALSLQQLDPILMGFEGWTLFNRSHREVTAQQPNPQLRVSSSANHQAGAVHEGEMVINGRFFQFLQRLFHFIKAVRMAEEYGEFSPGARSRFRSRNAGAVLTFGFGEVLISF